jgi:deazaflavin-dependent oxidoreductase (nitroreductase family)
MPEKIKEIKLPRGLSRLAFRAPLWFYRHGMGWLFGDRMLELTHTGRVTGALHQTALEVVWHDKASGVFYIASGWGERSDWYQNIMANPSVTVQSGRQRFKACAERLSSEEAEAVLVDYAGRHPLALRELADFMGYRLDGTEADLRALAHLIPIFALRPETSEAVKS